MLCFYRLPQNQVKAVMRLKRYIPLIVFSELLFLTGLAQTDSLKTDSSFYDLPGVVISASRRREQILQAPVSIEKLELKDIRQSAKPSFFDAIENVKGIQMITPSLGFKVINARGFTNTTNVRFVQMVDGMDIQAPHIGAPIANTLGPTDLDISSVEIIPGSSSAIYGMNAINGTADFMTKNPFLFQGLAVQQKTGVNHLNDDNRDAAIFSETAIRWAKGYNNRFAFKINAAFATGVDWYANNRLDLNPNANITTGLTGDENPGKDIVNQYGDESPNRKTLTLNGKQYVVSRTGYAEKDMASYELQNLKADAALIYRFKNKTDISYTFRIAHTNTIYQRTNRFRLDDYLTQQHGIALRSSSVQFKAYINTENTGNSYNIRSMAENIDRYYKSDDQWFRDFTKRFNSNAAQGVAVPDAMDNARLFADSGRPVPHTAETDYLIDTLRNVNDWNYGAALHVRTSMIHTEMQHDLTETLLHELKIKYQLELMYGFDFREYIVVPDGNYFINPEKDGENLIYWKAGGFVQATKYFFERKLKLNAVLRVEKNKYFDAKFSRRIAAVYSPVEQHNFRIAFQSGYRFPSLFEAFSNINSGGVKRVGGLPEMSSGIFENSYLRKSIDVFQAAVNKDVNSNSIPLNNAIIKNQDLLKRNPYTYIEPEYVRCIEAGYRGVFWKGKFSIDADFYYNIYKNLMAQVEANIPRTNDPDSIAFYLYDKNKQDRYRLWTNSKTVSYNYGGTLGLTWNMPKNFRLYGNVTLAKLDRAEQQDGLEDGFNTPQWIYNISLGNPSLFKSPFGFNINYRRQSSFLWQSSLATGTVPAYGAADAQVQYTFLKNHLNVKIGASNLFNKYYYSFIGGPAIGGLYYSTITLNIL
jgi:outer membrane receptor protein involved in Fe transport